MDIPESHDRRVDLFRSNSRVFRKANEMFAEPSRVKVMHGRRIRARSCRPLVGFYGQDKIADCLATVRRVIVNYVQAMPTHEAFISRHCAIAEAEGG